MTRSITPLMRAGLISATIFYITQSAGVFSTAAAQEVERLEIQPETTRGTPSQVRIPIARSAALLLAGMDQNFDLVIDMAEFDDGVAQSFAMADQDGSGVLTLSELSQWRVKALGGEDLMPGVFGFDVNFDSRVPFDEFRAALKFEFDQKDSDRDEVVQFSDLLSLRNAPQRSGRGGEEGSGESREGRGPSQGGGGRQRR